MVRSIGSKLGHVEEVSIFESTNTREASVWVKIRFDVDDLITLSRWVEIMKGERPVLLKFRYKGLQKFCTTCGSLKHEYEVCSAYANLSQRSMEMMDTITNPYATVEERNNAIS
ncbi:hypothetical protein N665_0532s0061 [Sinapis alba]|nr:hypothetical protein N665_0532s0061 [Sinapis alba]